MPCRDSATVEPFISGSLSQPRLTSDINDTTSLLITAEAIIDPSEMSAISDLCQLSQLSIREFTGTVNERPRDKQTLDKRQHGSFDLSGPLTLDPKRTVLAIPVLVA